MLPMIAIHCAMDTSHPITRMVSIDTPPYTTMIVKRLICKSNLTHEGIGSKRSIVAIIESRVIAHK